MIHYLAEQKHWRESEREQSTKAIVVEILHIVYVCTKDEIKKYWDWALF